MFLTSDQFKNRFHWNWCEHVWGRQICFGSSVQRILHWEAWLLLACFSGFLAWRLSLSCPLKRKRHHLNWGGIKSYQCLSFSFPIHQLGSDNRADKYPLLLGLCLCYLGFLGVLHTNTERPRTVNPLCQSKVRFLWRGDTATVRGETNTEPSGPHELPQTRCIQS